MGEKLTSGHDPNSPTIASPSGLCWKGIVFTAMAAGLGWGIRGQYGHESGAMIAGVLASLTLIIFFAQNGTPLAASRAAAMATIAIGVGGSMTYAQTVGLTHDKQFIGNWEAWRWGMLGLFVKGGIWIGFFGAFLGMGLGGKRYAPLEMALVSLSLIGLMFFGVWLLNSPFDPEHKILPKIYFSASWYFEPDRIDLQPRPENWGGLLTALVALIAYVGFFRKDTLAVRLGLCAFAAGGIGQAGGQCIQSYHSWNPEVFAQGWFAKLEVFRVFNWWNMMETGFGFIFGGLVAWSVWLNRHLIAIHKVASDVPFGPTQEIFLCVLHLVLLLTAEFLTIPSSIAGVDIPFEIYTDISFVMCVIPLVGIAGGKFWPCLQLLLIVAAPIMGKEMRELCIAGPPDYPHYSEHLGWLIFVMIPTAAMVVVTVALIAHSAKGLTAAKFAAISLVASTWLYFGLNTFFFGFAWPWQPIRDWTYRTPNQLVFMICTAALTWLAVRTIIRNPTQA